MIKENGWDWSVSSRICNWDNTMLLHSRRRAYNDIECESGEPHEEWNRHTKSFFLFLFLQIIKHDWFFVRPYSRQVIKSLVQTSRFQWLPFHDHCTFIKSFDLNINSVLISNWIGIFDSVIQLWPFMGRNSFFFLLRLYVLTIYIPNELCTCIGISISPQQEWNYTKKI